MWEQDKTGVAADCQINLQLSHLPLSTILIQESTTFQIDIAIISAAQIDIEMLGSASWIWLHVLITVVERRSQYRNRKYQNLFHETRSGTKKGTCLGFDF